MTAIEVITNLVGVVPGGDLPGIIIYASAFILVVMVADEIIDLMHLVARSMFFK